MKRREPALPATSSANPPPSARLQSGVRARVALVVDSQGLWFRMPDGPEVSVERWRPLQRLLARLADQREAMPGEPLSVEALIEAGWPGERMLLRAGATRVYTAIASLRRLGLRDILLREERGYLLTSSVPLERPEPIAERA